MSMKEFSCQKSHSLILSAVSLLRDRGLYTSAKGLYDILIGVHKDLKAKELECYGYYSNLSSRTFHSRVRLLLRYGYLSNLYKEEINDYVLVLTEKGKREVRSVKWHAPKAEETNLLEIKEEL